MVPYPKWLYHATRDALVVKDEAEHKALGAGWVESPADVKPATKEAETTAELAEELGARSLGSMVSSVATSKPPKRGR